MPSSEVLLKNVFSALERFFMDPDGNAKSVKDGLRKIIDECESMLDALDESDTTLD